MSKSVTYVDITPTWREILPALVALLDNPITQSDALMELSRMAKLADERLTQLKADAGSPRVAQLKED